MTKSELRRLVLRRRDALGVEARQGMDRRIANHLRDLRSFRDARTILFFVSFRSEVDTKALIAEALGAGRQVAVPRVVGPGLLDLHRIESLEDLEPGGMGILEPRARAERIRPEVLDLVLMPGAVFDPDGNRIGYGGGYYDRLLRDTPRRVQRVAVAYATQIVDHVPAESHDERVDNIVTEDGILTCRPR